MQDLATAVSGVGTLLIEGGQETTTNMDGYYAELSEAYKNNDRTPEFSWRYTIERS
jgi:hypothetical protein